MKKGFATKKVTHEQYGEGTVLRVEGPKGRPSLIVVQFKDEIKAFPLGSNSLKFSPKED
ncbi:hypothetical protein [Larkinella knui]|uniref:hypothetical protein n=1 Tax=Larkinella knui TaxID=2025310 RepID=UPI00163AF4AD|nr:hypothetical protein [Larkinella knui]